MATPLLDNNGAKVVHFAADVRTLGKIGELADKIIEMAESGAWRRYRTAVGSDKWLECEFDYFLISCDLEYDDVYRAIKWEKLGEQVRAMMDHDADPAERRPLEQAAAKWHSPTAEMLVERAARLGWIKTDGSARSPLSERQRRKQAAGGKTNEQQARDQRRKRVTAKRRRELDRLATDTLAGLADDDERRYLLDAITTRLARKPGRPTGDHEQWAKDIADLDADTKKLAQHWSVNPAAARQRVASVRKYANKITAR